MYSMFLTPFMLSPFQPDSICPKYLYLRWHLVPMFVAFFATIEGFVFFQLGWWCPPLTWGIAVVWGLCCYVLQMVKMHYRQEANVGIRCAQIVGSWSIVILNTLALAIGAHIAP